jgi:hypothetical protein
MKPSLNILLVAGNSLGYKHTEDSKNKMSALKKDKDSAGGGVPGPGPET